MLPLDAHHPPPTNSPSLNVQPSPSKSSNLRHAFQNHSMLTAVTHILAGAATPSHPLPPIPLYSIRPLICNAASWSNLPSVLAHLPYRSSHGTFSAILDLNLNFPD